MIRVRIAPSPTGPLHVGTARTALFNFLYAKKNKGKFILRIEDTDLERSDERFEKDIIDGLQWLGIEWDGEITRQSERLNTYEKLIKKLLEDGKAFRCGHSNEMLEHERKEQMARKESPRHVCGDRDKNLDKGIIRLKNTATENITFSDEIRGEISFDPKLLGDISLAKDIRVPLYNFAVVVDDQEMDISHVIRGEDHISNTPKQILIQEALSFKRPAYAHLPLILGSDRSKLSKRHGATSVGEYCEQGYLPETLFNFMALLGWNPGDDREILSREELIKEFSLEKVQKAGAIFDLQKLDWMNGEYIRQKPIDELSTLCMPYLEKAGLFMNQESGIRNQERLEKIIALEQPRLKKLSELPEKVDYFFRQPEYGKELLRWKKMTDDEITSSLDTSIKLLKSDFNSIEKVLLDEAKKTGDRGILLWPLRVALTGKKASPGPFEIMEILGKEESFKRLEQAKKHLMS